MYSLDSILTHEKTLPIVAKFRYAHHWQLQFLRRSNNPMLRVTESKNAAAAKQHFGKSMVRSDYYSEGQEIAGLWGGIAAERLGLSGTVDQESYFALCDNLD